MDKIILLAHAKLNLSLDITGLREDGYHLMDMVMQSVSLSDCVTLEKSDTLSPDDFEYGESDTGYRAAKLFFDTTGIKGGVKVSIEKTIPSQAGMAGGSADAAAVLVGLNRMYRTGLNRNELCAMGVKIGADVPFCLVGGTARVGGIGEKIEPLPFFGQGHYLIVKPPFGVSTPAAFKAFDSMPDCPSPDQKRLIAAMERFDIAEMAAATENVLERAAVLDTIGQIRRALIEHGAGMSLMTGSGSAVFGLYERIEDAVKAANMPEIRKLGEIFVCSPAPEGVTVAMEN